MTHRLNRRQVIKGGALAGITILTASKTARSEEAKQNAAPSAEATQKLRCACIGAGGMASKGISQTLGEHIVAIAEVDQGSKKAAENIKKVKEKFPDVKLYTDYRELFDKHQDLDAVWVGCPDHNHFGASVRGLELGASVYCEKPLSWSIGEARKLREMAAEKKVATQMGNQGHSSESIRLIVEYLRAGSLGKVTKVIGQMNKKWGAEALPAPAAKPEGLDWNAWLGPATEMEYMPKVHPRDWRKFVPFGTGTLGDMACHTLDGAVWGLRLTEVEQFDVEAEQGMATVGGHPIDAVYRWDFPALGEQAALSLWWYQGDLKPDLSEELQALNMRGMHTLYLGDKGAMVSNSHCQTARLRPETFHQEVGKPEQLIPRIEKGHEGDFLRAARNPGSELPSSHFGYSAGLTEILLAGVIASRVGEKLTYSMKEGRFLNNDNANGLLWRTPRKGWEFGYPT
ncbi:MAG: Gfo/Idh/MocA family oxidoreductase [Planctomycetota bacterium]|nr:Gfo/Idh/MocA family oxidoreductase [Planctomycetota bacterium]